MQSNELDYLMFEPTKILRWLKTEEPVKVNLSSSGYTPPVMLSDLDLNLNEIPFNENNYYGYDPLRKTIADRYSTTVDRVMITTGASVGNFLTLCGLQDKIKRVIIERPAYEPFVRQAEHLYPGKIHRLERKASENYAIDTAALEKLLVPDSLVFISNLHNPSGVLASPEKISMIGNLLRDHSSYLLVDEVFKAFAEGGDSQYDASLGENIISSNSLTKSWGLWPLRIGWIICEPWIIDRALNPIDATYNVQCSMTEFIANYALQPGRKADRLLAEAKSIAADNWNLIRQFVCDHDILECTIPAGGISCFSRFKDNRNADEFCSRLLKQYSTMVVPGSYFEAPEGFRISYGIDKEILQQGLENIDHVLRG